MFCRIFMKVIIWDFCESKVIGHFCFRWFFWVRMFMNHPLNSLIDLHPWFIVHLRSRSDHIFSGNFNASPWFVFYGSFTEFDLQFAPAEKKKSLAEKAKNTTPLSGDFVDLMAKRWHQVAKTTTIPGDFFSDGTRSEESQESQVLIPKIHEEAATVDAQVHVHHTETLNDEDVVVSDPPVTKSCPALLPDKKWTILPVPVIAVIQLPTWWIWAPESFIQENSDRLLQFGPKPPLVPLVNGVPHFLHRLVRVKEKPRYLLGQKQCAICERIFCGHGTQCTRKNFSCKWCHFPHTEECFFSFKDKNKFILKTRGEGFCGKLTDL